ncbi:hypothetical protein [Planococcus halocryophilus]|uniref:Transposase n=1 Tax=Planococcus halocryophilus TaxID=1215089 RepID=A0A1C7DRK1_9BACL|nr:hypothetical protein [Planococcus halocryophilus]ANU13968.1 hypothetical protein BBI08_08945 [Planococcus halocryophilus]
MEEYNSYKEKVEKQHNKAIVEVVKDLYVNEDIGPSVSAKKLGIPRQAFIYFVELYDLKRLKFANSKKKTISLSRSELIQ